MVSWGKIKKLEYGYRINSQTTKRSIENHRIKKNECPWMSFSLPTWLYHGEGACQIFWGFLTSLWLSTQFFPKVRFFPVKFLTLCILLLLFIVTGPVVEWLNHLRTLSMREGKEVKRQEAWNIALSCAKLTHAWLI